MIRVHRVSRFPTLWALVLLPIVLLLSLPLLIAALGLAVVGAFVGWRSLKRASRSNPLHSQGLSPIIDNPEIGPYRIRQSSSDPSVIEVLDDDK